MNWAAIGTMIAAITLLLNVGVLFVAGSSWGQLKQKVEGHEARLDVHEVRINNLTESRGTAAGR